MTASSFDPTRPTEHPSEAEALRVLHRAHRWTRWYSWWGERMVDGWFLRFAPGPAPAEAPSWIVLDDGPVIPVHRIDTLEQARARAGAPARSL